MATNIKLGFFTLRPSSPDKRDYKYTTKNVELRPAVDLREWDSVVENQLDLGSCVGNAITNCYELETNRLYPESFKQLSRLFVYYNGRLLEGTTEYDEGVEIRSAVKASAHFGICTEELWPYSIGMFTTKPTPECYRDGSHRVISKYQRLYSLADILDAINANYPVVAGMFVYENFLYLDKDNYVVQNPSYNEQAIGAHAMAVVGYDLDAKHLIVKNSFGVDWGLNGYCYIPFDYIKTQGFEHWIFDIASPPMLTS